MECTVGDVKVYYEIYGEGIPVLMLHGWSVDHRLMKGCMEPAFEAMDTTFKRIYFDLPGMGKTKGKTWITSSDQMLDLIFDFIDAVIPKQHFIVAGESYGGYLARGIISKRSTSVDGLLLICPTVGQDGAQYQVFEKDERFLSTLTEEDRKYFVAEGINVIHNERTWMRYKDEVLQALKIADYSFLKNLQWQFSFNVDDPEKQYIKPTLMLAGRQDSIVGYKKLWNIIELYPRASFILLDKAGHALQIEQHVMLTEAVKEWLKRAVEEINLA
jgi:pimeloyl-ACP methyl ester carboxylesterase